MVELELEVLGHYQEMASRLIGQCIQILHTPPQQHSRDGDILNNDSAAKILGHRKVKAKNSSMFKNPGTMLPTMPS